MAETAGVINGTLITVSLNGTLIAAGTSHTISLTGATRDTTNKDNAGWRTIMPGVKSWTVSGSHMFEFDATYGFSDLYSIYNLRTEVDITCGSENAGDQYYKGKAYITSLSLDAPSEENATYSYTFEGTGALTEYTTT